MHKTKPIIAPNSNYRLHFLKPLLLNFCIKYPDQIPPLTPNNCYYLDQAKDIQYASGIMFIPSPIGSVRYISSRLLFFGQWRFLYRFEW